MIKRNPKEIVLSALLRMSEQMPFYIFTVFVLEYGTDELGFGKTFLTNSVGGAAALALFFVPLFGHLSDRIGRKRMYIDRRGADVSAGRSRTSRCSNTGARRSSRWRSSSR